MRVVNRDRDEPRGVDPVLARSFVLLLEAFLSRIARRAFDDDEDRPWKARDTFSRA